MADIYWLIVSGLAIVIIGTVMSVLSDLADSRTSHAMFPQPKENTDATSD